MKHTMTEPCQAPGLAERPPQKQQTTISSESSQSCREMPFVSGACYLALLEWNRSCLWTFQHQPSPRGRD